LVEQVKIIFGLLKPIYHDHNLFFSLHLIWLLLDVHTDCKKQLSRKSEQELISTLQAIIFVILFVKKIKKV